MSIDSQPAHSGEPYEVPELIVLEFEDTEGKPFHTAEFNITVGAS